MDFTLRISSSEDRDFLWEMRQATMKVYFAETYGWDEETQRARARENDECRIVMRAGQPIGAIELNDLGDQLHLARMQVLPELQNQGIGTELVKWAQSEARRKNLPITLQVLKNNPAKHLYDRLGFEVCGELGHTHKMHWSSVDDKAAGKEG